jgi:hypothetical protein
MAEVSRIMKPGATLILTTNNASEMPEKSPLRDPLTWIERLVGRWKTGLLSFRNITWHEPINDPADPLPRDAPTFAPHFHFSFAELRDLGTAAGLEVVRSGSFEFPAPQSKLAAWLRAAVDRNPRVGLAVSDQLERTIAGLPGLRLMGTHNLVVYRKVATTSWQPGQWWVANLVPAAAASNGAEHGSDLMHATPGTD